MSLGRRAYDLLRGYVNTEWDRIHEVEDDPASLELAQSLANPSPKPAGEQPKPEPGPIAQTQEERADLARRILGVETAAGFSEIRHAYDRINRRADPANFPLGSPEAVQAAQIQRRVQWAYAILTETMDVTEKRFRSLEIE
jgi:hypothetical protein